MIGKSHAQACILILKISSTDYVSVERGKLECEAYVSFEISEQGIGGLAKSHPRRLPEEYCQLLR